MKAVKRSKTAAATLAIALALAPTRALAGETGEKVGGVVQESGRTAGEAVVDSVQTFGRTVRDFFTGGASQAKQTWKENAAETKHDARTIADAVKREADR